MKPADPKRSDGPVSGTAACVNEPNKPDALAELSRWLRSQWLRHDVLFKALGLEADRLAAARLAKFAATVKEVQSWQR